MWHFRIVFYTKENNQTKSHEKETQNHDNLKKMTIFVAASDQVKLKS